MISICRGNPAGQLQDYITFKAGLYCSCTTRINEHPCGVWRVATVTSLTITSLTVIKN